MHHLHPPLSPQRLSDHPSDGSQIFHDPRWAMESITRFMTFARGSSALLYQKAHLMINPRTFTSYVDQSLIKETFTIVKYILKFAIKAWYCDLWPTWGVACNLTAHKETCSPHESSTTPPKNTTVVSQASAHSRVSAHVPQFKRPLYQLLYKFLFWSCGPKLRVVFKRPWVLTRDTTVPPMKSIPLQRKYSTTDCTMTVTFWPMGLQYRRLINHLLTSLYVNNYLFTYLWKFT